MPAATTDIVLAGDGAFRLTRHDDAGRVVASVSGRWRLDRKRTLGVEVQRVEAGDPTRVGQTTGLGTVVTVDGNRMVLKTDDGEEVLRRSP